MEREYPHHTPITPTMETSQADDRGVARAVVEAEEEVANAAIRRGLTRTMKMVPP